MDQISCLGVFGARSQLQQADIPFYLFDLVKDHRIHSRLTAICCCSLFMAHLRCHSSAGVYVLLDRSRRYFREAKRAEATTHGSMAGIQRRSINNAYTAPRRQAWRLGR